MHPEDLQQRWEEEGEDVFAAVAQWRAAHPKATLAEIEQAVDQQINRLRAVWTAVASARTSETEVADAWRTRGGSRT